jgi:hypothetical protein
VHGSWFGCLITPKGGLEKGGFVSINSMAEAAVEGRLRSQAPEVTREGKSGTGLEATGAAPPPTAPARGTETRAVSDALKQVVTYIPSEIVGAYLVVVGLLASSASGVLWGIYFVFLVLTPVAVWAAVAAKSRAKGLTPANQSRKWPTWSMVAASLTFAVWAAALPGSIFNNLSWYSPAVGSVAVVIAALLVGILSPVIGEE